MPPIRHLPHAPITEALIDLRVDLPSGAVFANLEPFYEAVRDRYPVREELTGWSASVDLSKEGAAFHGASSVQNGLLLRTSDRVRAVQARLDGFTFSRMAPYSNWQELRDEAKVLWSQYAAMVNPTRITRMAVRYINRIEIPMPVGRLDDHFLTRPELGDDLKLPVSGLLMRLILPDPSKQSFCIFTQASEPATETVQPFLIDIDVVREASTLPADEGVWSILEYLRNQKNAVFFSSLTEKTLRRFE